MIKKLKNFLSVLLLAAISCGVQAQTFKVQDLNVLGNTTLANPLPYTSGGTGINTITQYAPVVGGATGFSFVGVGTAGQVLTSNGAGQYPSFQTISSATILSNMAALKAVSTASAAAYGTVYITGYTIPGDGGQGFFNWNATSTLADNTGTIIQPSSLPTSGRWLRDQYTKGLYTPEMFGTLDNGSADDAAGIRTAMLALHNLTNGGTLQLACNTTYTLASYAGNSLHSLIYPYSNVNIVGCGNSSVLKVANGMNTGSIGYMVIYPVDSTSANPVNNAQFRNFAIDDNGANNSCSNTCYYNNVNIGAAYGDGILIDGVTVTHNPGSQDFSFGTNSVNPTMQNVRIVNSRDENACDLVNSACTDFSAIYLDVVNGVIANNVFLNSSQSSKNTAFEIHGYNISATGNVVYNYNVGTNIAAQSANTENISVIGNNFINVYTAARLWDTTTGTVLGTISFIGNTISLTDETGGPALDLDQDVVSGSSAQEITVAGNTFSSNQATGTSAIFGGIRLGLWVQQNIVGNTFRLFSGPAIYIGSHGVNNSSILNITNNTIFDSGSTSTSASKIDISLNSAVNAALLNVNGNSIQSDSGYATTGISGNVSSQGQSAVYGNSIGGSGITTTVNMTGTNINTGVTCGTGAPTSSYKSYAGLQTHC